MQGPSSVPRKGDEVLDLVAGYRTWADAEVITVESRTEPPAATTTFCAFWVSYSFAQMTVKDSC